MKISQIFAILALLILALALLRGLFRLTGKSTKLTVDGSQRPNREVDYYIENVGHHSSENASDHSCD